MCWYTSYAGVCLCWGRHQRAVVVFCPGCVHILQKHIKQVALSPSSNEACALSDILSSEVNHVSNTSCFRVFKGQKPITAETEKSVCGSRLGQTPNKSPFLLPLRGLFAFFRGGHGNMGALWFVSPRHRSNVFLRRRGRKLNSCQSQVNNGDCKYLHIDNTTCLQCLWGRDSRVYRFGCVFPVRALIIVNMFYTFEWHFSISFGRPL